MHLDSQMVGLGMRPGQRPDDLPGAETDLETARCGPAEDLVQVERPPVEIHAEDRPQVGQGPFLRLGHPSGA